MIRFNEREGVNHIDMELSRSHIPIQCVYDIYNLSKLRSPTSSIHYSKLKVGETNLQCFDYYGINT